MLQKIPFNSLFSYSFMVKIEIKTIVNDSKTCYYNVVCVDNMWAINYSDNGPIPITDIPESFFIENQVEVKDTW